LFFFTRRPISKSAKSIGFWNKVLKFIQIAAIFTNAGIISFTSNKDFVDESGTFIEQMTEERRIYLFASLLTFFLLVKIFVGLAYQRLPHIYWQVAKRHQVLVQKYFKKSTITSKLNLVKAGMYNRFG
jgi:hypothetical protein